MHKHVNELQIIFRRLGLEKQPWGGGIMVSEKRIERVNDGDPGKTRLQPTAENGCRAGLDPARGIAGVAPAAALAAGDGDRIVKTFTYMEASGMPEGLVPSSIEFGGNAYKLEKQGEPYVDESYERQTAELEHDTTVEAGVLDVSYAIASMPATMDASTIDPLYEGDRRLTASSRSRLPAPHPSG